MLEEIDSLFHHFNARFFEGKIPSENYGFSWSKRFKTVSGMYKEYVIQDPETLDAETLYYEIVLSEAILKKLPQIETINVLIHEMIHAWTTLVLEAEEIHGHHFKKKLKEINTLEDRLSIHVRHDYPYPGYANNKRKERKEGPLKFKKTSLFIALKKTFYVCFPEDGIQHDGEKEIAAALKIDQDTTLKWLKSWLLSSREPWFRANLLMLLSRFPEIGDSVWRRKVVEASLASKFIEVRDPALVAAESWGDCWDIVEDYVALEEVDYLRRYAEDIIEDQKIRRSS